jgi:hypothetical protein
MQILRIAILATIGFALPVSAMAGCWYNGKLYPTGTRIGAVVCQPNGAWRP